jgi:chloramphenicol-sensitive protein RarD
VAESRRGITLGVAAYALWGLFPLYWPLLEPAGAVEILAHRIFWSLIVMAVLVVAARRTAQFRANLRNPRVRNLLTLAAVLVTCNWGTYIWGVNHKHVVETSLGYFINPLVTVLMGVLILGERLRRWQWIALGLATAAVVALTVEYGQPPWIALILAFSFGSYGLCKKKANVGAVESLAFETTVLAPFALAYIVFLTATGASHFTNSGAGHAALLVGTGIVTAVPLICFGGAATRLSMTMLGMLQYLAPVIQFLLGVFALHEPMPPMRWVGFVLVWLALAMFSAESYLHRREAGREVVEPVGV